MERSFNLIALKLFLWDFAQSFSKTIIIDRLTLICNCYMYDDGMSHLMPVKKPYLADRGLGCCVASLALGCT